MKYILSGFRTPKPGAIPDLFKALINKPFSVDKNITIRGIVEILKVNRKYLI